MKLLAVITESEAIFDMICEEECVPASQEFAFMISTCEDMDKAMMLNPSKKFIVVLAPDARETEIYNEYGEQGLIDQFDAHGKRARGF